jgi:ribosomal protein S18 acetylase RimI-like enzyme
MNDPVEVRPVDFDDPTDVAHYLAMLDRYARDPMGAGRALPESVRIKLPGDLAANPAAHCLIALEHGQAVGFATCFVGYSTFRARPLLNLHDIAVIPAARGRGIGAAVLEAVDELARRLDCCKVTLEVRSDNAGAQRVYERAGFVSAECDRFMEKELPATSSLVV